MQVIFCFFWESKILKKKAFPRGNSASLLKRGRMRHILGIDIGGSGVKGAPVDIKTGALLAERYRVPTPCPCTPEALLEAVAAIHARFEGVSAVGVGFPGVVKNDTIYNAPNLDASLTGLRLGDKISKKFGVPCAVLNDADAAAVAEMRFGAGKGLKGLTILVTVGTGIGSGVFYNGVLIPNIEFGHIKMKDKATGKYRESEKMAGDAARRRCDLSWEEWAARFSRHLKYLCSVFWPDRIILGGGIVKKADKFLDKLESPVPLVLAHFGNTAGIVGAAANADAARRKK